VHCLHGIGTPTPGVLVYYTSSKNWFDHSPSLVTDDGDGTVNVRSLRGCLRWSSKQSAAVHHQEFTGAPGEHLSLLNNPDVMSYIAQHMT